jgi:hypothetical protein
VSDKLLKAIRGKDYRAAFKAIAALRGAPRDLSQEKAKDEQRAFQLGVARLVAERGVAGLAAGWAGLGPAPWRAALISEIGQFCGLWAEEALVDVALAALEDESREVQAQAVWTLLGWLRGAPAMQDWITRERRARLTRAYGTMLWNNRKERYVVLAQIVESLGYTARASDAGIIDMLEALRPQSGESHAVSYEKLDESTLDWRTRQVAERKKVDPASIKLRISYTPTGLLDARVLEGALRRIRENAGAP